MRDNRSALSSNTHRGLCFSSEEEKNKGSQVSALSKHKSSLGCSAAVGKCIECLSHWLSLSHSTESSSHREKLIPEPVCGLLCAKASLPHANLSPISLSNSRQVCTLHITNKPKTHSHTLKPFREKKKTYASTYCVL